MKRLLLTVAMALPILAYVGEWTGAFAGSDSSIFRYIGKCVADGGRRSGVHPIEMRVP